MRRFPMMRVMGVVALAVGTLLLSAPPAPAYSGSCYETGDTGWWSGAGGGGAGYGVCEDEISCPADHQEPCKVVVRAETRGTGLVGVAAEVEGERVGTCSYTPNQCTTRGTAFVRRGDYVVVGCSLYENLAADVTLECVWTVS